MDLLQLITKHTSIPYIYSYPTTRGYESITNFDISQVQFSDNINLYFHIPFCGQKCSFCGYLTTVLTKEAEYETYVEALIKEIKNATHLHEKRISTINFGGGTPMMLSEFQLIKIMEQIKVSFPNFLNTAKEISIEATPESITEEKTALLKDLGFNRISMGVQTLNAAEIKSIKRHNFSQSTRQAIEIVQASGINNLCCDLMYGLPGQDLESWEQTVLGLLEYRPQTIELYRTVSIPKTGFSKEVSFQLLNEEKYEAYEYAREKLLSSGYLQDSHLRFILPDKGFYQQQVNVFKGESLCGFGVGARTYADNVHYRNCYDSSKHRLAIQRYINAQKDHKSVVESAIFLNQEEKLIRYIIYNLESLDIKKIKQIFNVDITKKYKEIWDTLETLSLITVTEKDISLKYQAAYYRDAIAYSFFSETVKNKEESYYNGLNGIGT